MELIEMWVIKREGIEWTEIVKKKELIELRLVERRSWLKWDWLGEGIDWTEIVWERELIELRLVGWEEEMN